MKAIRLKHWAKIYSTRWRLDVADLAGEIYGPDLLPTPRELRQRVEMLHAIGEALDSLLEREEQWAYWNMPLPTTGAIPSDLLRLSWPVGCLAVLLEDIHQKITLLGIVERKVGHDTDAIVRFVEETVVLGKQSADRRGH